MTNKKQQMAVDRYFPKGDKRRGQALAVYAEAYVDAKFETRQLPEVVRMVEQGQEKKVKEFRELILRANEMFKGEDNCSRILNFIMDNIK